MDIEAAQRDISMAYIGGAPGVFVSGVVWLLAGVVALNYRPETTFAVLFFGGMLIVPTSLLIARVMFRASKASANNPLNRLGFEGTVVLFVGILIAYVLLRVAPDLAFPALALTIGARYFAFRTMYAEPTYWALGGVLAIVGTIGMLGLTNLPIGFLFVVGIAEFAFSALLLLRWKRRQGLGRAERIPR